MNYLVPHFLETEQRIWGPFTFNKFVIMIGVGGALFILYYSIGFTKWLLTAFFFTGGTLALLFGSYAGRPLYSALLDFFSHLFGKRRYTWEGVHGEESVSEFVLTKEKFRQLPSVAPQEKKGEKPVHERIKEVAKALDSSS